MKEKQTNKKNNEKPSFFGSKKKKQRKIKKNLLETKIKLCFKLMT